MDFPIIDLMDRDACYCQFFPTPTAGDALALHISILLARTTTKLAREVEAARNLGFGRC